MTTYPHLSLSLAMQLQCSHRHCIANLTGCHIETIQDSAKRRAPGCVNAAGKARQKWKATAGTKLPLLALNVILSFDVSYHMYQKVR